MDWEGVLAAESEEIEENEQLLESLFSFLLRHDLPRDSELIRDADSVAKILAVTRAVLKVGEMSSLVPRSVEMVIGPAGSRRYVRARASAECTCMSVTYT